MRTNRCKKNVQDFNDLIDPPRQIDESRCIVGTSESLFLQYLKAALKKIIIIIINEIT